MLSGCCHIPLDNLLLHFLEIRLGVGCSCLGYHLQVLRSVEGSIGVRVSGHWVRHLYRIRKIFEAYENKEDKAKQTLHQLYDRVL